MLRYIEVFYIFLPYILLWRKGMFFKSICLSISITYSAAHNMEKNHNWKLKHIVVAKVYSIIIKVNNKKKCYTFRTRSASESFLLIVICVVVDGGGGGDGDGRRTVTVSEETKWIMTWDFWILFKWHLIINLVVPTSCYYSRCGLVALE